MLCSLCFFLFVFKIFLSFCLLYPHVIFLLLLLPILNFFILLRFIRFSHVLPFFLALLARMKVLWIGLCSCALRDVISCVFLWDSLEMLSLLDRLCLSCFGKQWAKQFSHCAPKLRRICCWFLKRPCMSLSSAFLVFEIKLSGCRSRLLPLQLCNHTMRAPDDKRLRRSLSIGTQEDRLLVLQNVRHQFRRWWESVHDRRLRLFKP